MICVPITASNMKDALDDIDKANAIADIIELFLLNLRAGRQKRSFGSA